MGDVIAIPPVILQKPEYGSPCNGCGFCCNEEICRIGKQIFPEAVAPCPALSWEDGRYRCQVVMAEEMMVADNPEKKAIVKEMLGIGWGCDARSWDVETGELTIP